METVKQSRQFGRSVAALLTGFIDEPAGKTCCGRAIVIMMNKVERKQVSVLPL